MSPQWTPPTADKQAWTPPAADKQGGSPRDHGDRLKGTPTNFPDNYMGTLAKDLAALPENTWNAVTHPIDTVKGAVRQLLNLPGDVVTDISQGNWGKLAAKVTELAVPALSTERGAAAAGAAGAAVKDAAGAVVRKGVEVASNPVARELIGVASPRLKNALAAVNRVKTAAEKSAAEDAAAVAPTPAAGMTPGQELAQKIGTDWESLTAQDRALLEHSAKAEANVASPGPGIQRPPMGPPPAEAAAPPPEAPPVENLTLAQMIEREYGSAAQPEAAGPPIGAHPMNPPVNGRGAPLRPPMAKTASDLNPAATPAQVPPEPAQVAAVPEPVPAQAPPPRTLPQVEAGMARTGPAVTEAPRSIYDVNGERKSPQLRAAEIKGANAASKAERFAQAFRAEGVTAEDLGNMTAMELQQMTDGMIAKGALQPGETVPKSSYPQLKARLKELQQANGAPKPGADSPMLDPKKAKAAEIARQLKEAMENDK